MHSKREPNFKGGENSKNKIYKKRNNIRRKRTKGQDPAHKVQALHPRTHHLLHNLKTKEEGGNKEKVDEETRKKMVNGRTRSKDKNKVQEIREIGNIRKIKAIKEIKEGVIKGVEKAIEKIIGMIPDMMEGIKPRQ